MFIIKRLLQLQGGQFNFRYNESLNILGVVRKKREPLIPYDKDMTGAVIIDNITSTGDIVRLQFSAYQTTAEHVAIIDILSTGTVELA